MRFLWWLVIAGAAALAACAPALPARTIELEMKDVLFSPSTLTVRGGERVLLRFRNAGTTDHEFMAGREPRADGGYKEDLFQGLPVRMVGGSAEGHAMSHGGFGLIVANGRSGAIEFTVPSKPGTYEFACFIPGHYEAGMRGTLVIE